jgi:hypothetical protein
LSQSDWRDDFVLKGAMLFRVWNRLRESLALGRSLEELGDRADLTSLNAAANLSIRGFSGPVQGDIIV